MWVAIVALVLILSFAACSEKEVKEVKKYVPKARAVPEVLESGYYKKWTYEGMLDFTIKVIGTVRNVGAAGRIRVTARVYLEGLGVRPFEKSKVIYLFHREEREVVFFFPEITLDDDLGKCQLFARPA